MATAESRIQIYRYAQNVCAVLPRMHFVPLLLPSKVHLRRVFCPPSAVSTGKFPSGSEANMHFSLLHGPPRVFGASRWLSVHGQGIPKVTSQPALPFTNLLRKVLGASPIRMERTARAGSEYSVPPHEERTASASASVGNGRDVHVTTVLCWADG